MVKQIFNERSFNGLVCLAENYCPMELQTSESNGINLLFAFLIVPRLFPASTSLSIFIDSGEKDLITSPWVTQAIINASKKGKTIALVEKLGEGNTFPMNRKLYDFSKGRGNFANIHGWVNFDYAKSTPYLESEIGKIFSNGEPKSFYADSRGRIFYHEEESYRYCLGGKSKAKELHDLIINFSYNPKIEKIIRKGEEAKKILKMQKNN